MGRAGWPRDPGHAGLLEAEGTGAAGARQGSPPPTIWYSQRLGRQTPDGTWSKAARRRGKGRRTGGLFSAEGRRVGRDTQIE